MVSWPETEQEPQLSGEGDDESGISRAWLEVAYSSELRSLQVVRRGQAFDQLEVCACH